MDHTLIYIIVNVFGLAELCMVIWLVKQLLLVSVFLIKAAIILCSMCNKY